MNFINDKLLPAELYDVGQLLRLDPHGLRGCLLSRHLELGPDNLVTDLSAGEAGNTRDTLCRTLYSRLFTYVVSRINESIKVTNKEKDSHFNVYFAGINH